MKKPQALVLYDIPQEIEKISNWLNRCRSLPYFDIHQYDSVKEFMERGRFADLQVCFISHRFVVETPGITQTLTDHYPLAQIIITPQLIPEDTHIDLGVRESVNEAQGINIGEINKYYLPCQTSKLRDNIISHISRLLREGGLTQKLRIKLNGGGKFAQELLEGLKPMKFVSVDWYAESVAENTDNPENPYSYRSIINAKALQSMIEEGRLTAHKTLDDFLEELTSTDLILFATGPHKTGYGKMSRESLRGKKSMNFYEELFENTAPKLKKMMNQVDYRDYKGKIWIFSNPVGALCNLASRVSNCDPKNISSPTCDGIRAFSLLIERINSNKEDIYQVAKELSDDDHSQDPNERRLEIEEIYKFPIAGEHHNPIYFFEGVKIKTDLGRVLSLHEVYKKIKNEIFQENFINEIKARAVQTMVDAENLGTGYREAPCSVFEAIERHAHLQMPVPHMTFYQFIERENTYLVLPGHYDFRERRLVPILTSKDLSKTRERKIEKQIHDQRALVDRFLF
jgi:hypothetical protein